MRKIDILLLARADHSVGIYNALENQKKLKFHFLTFRVLKRCFKIFGIKKVVYVGRNTTILIRLTLGHILKYKFNKYSNLNEKKYFSAGIEKVLKAYTPQIIHYWPSYCFDFIALYKQKYPHIVSIAEQYMPNPLYVLKDMESVYEKYGINIEDTYLSRYAKAIQHHFVGADYIMVPSKYVEETMRFSFPDKKYICIPYGIDKSPLLEEPSKKDSIKEFVYVGGLSLEKGTDIILEYFSKHQYFNLHLYGQIKTNQSHIFEKYRIYNNIYFHGAVSKNELKKAFKKMDVGIHPSRFDAYSLAVGEEIGAGLPVILSNKTGNYLDVIENDLGLVFNIDDYHSLSHAVKDICDLELYNRLIANNREYLSRSDIKSYGERIVDIYKELLSKQ